MRQFSLGLSISIAFIVGCVVAQRAPEMAIPTASAYAGQRWEYTCQEVEVSPTARDAKRGEEVGLLLNRLGAEGWEFIAFTNPQTHGVACFKRAQ